VMVFVTTFIKITVLLF